MRKSLVIIHTFRHEHLLIASPYSSFLPQDKVAEFAKMNPQELLKATQEAAGHEKLLVWHQDLIKFGNEVRELSSVRIHSFYPVRRAEVEAYTLTEFS